MKRRGKQLLDDLKDRKGYWKRTVWETDFGKRLWTCRKTDNVIMISPIKC